MNITSILELNQDLLKRLGDKENLAYCFAIDNFHYDFKTYSITIEVVHYSNPNLIYQFVFPNVHSYKLMREEYLEFYDDEDWNGISFYAVSKHSRFEEFCFSNSLFAVQYLEVMDKDRSSLKTHRIAGQNEFLDILTDGEPLVTVLNRDTPNHD